MMYTMNCRYQVWAGKCVELYENEKKEKAVLVKSTTSKDLQSIQVQYTTVGTAGLQKPRNVGKSIPARCAIWLTVLVS